MLFCQSPGRGDFKADEFGRVDDELVVKDCPDGVPPPADDEPQLEAEMDIPIAAITRNIALLPATLPIEVRNSLLAIPFFFKAIISPVKKCKDNLVPRNKFYIFSDRTLI